MESNLLLACMVATQIFLIVLVLFLASRGTGLLLELFAELDNKIAEAITKLINEGSIDIEPPNPIQAIIAQLMQQKIQDITPRNEQGQFTVIDTNVE